jgi:hypothetical protein
MVDDVVVRSEEKAAGAAGRIADRLTGLGRDAVHHALDQRAPREVLAGPDFKSCAFFSSRPS